MAEFHEISLDEKLKTLINAQTHDLSSLEVKIRDLEANVASYDKLLNTLSTLGDKVKHEVMIPLGKVAFVPGKLVHTNEIYVNLGADLIALRSAKQAASLAEFRKQKIIKSLDMLKEGKKITKDWKEIAEQMGGEFRPEAGGITEVWTEEQENKWREEHRERVREAKRKEALKRDENEEEEQDWEKRMWAKLDELEKLEEMEDEELLKEAAEEKADPVKNESEVENMISDTIPPIRIPVQVKFRHQTLPPEPPSSCNPKFTQPGGIFTPADITSKIFERKSSLKSSKAEVKNERGRVGFHEDLVAVKTIENVSRGVPASMARLSLGAAQEVKQMDEKPPPQRISRFKAARAMEKASQ